MNNPLIPIQHAPDSATKIQGLEINAAYGCNLKCEQCTHFGRYLHGIESVENLILWSETWNPKLIPCELRIMGGEPLLHPELDQIIRSLRDLWKYSFLVLITNGLLVKNAPKKLFKAIRETGIHVIVSKHFDDPDYNAGYFNGIEILRQHDIEPEIRRSDKFWFNCYRIGENGMPEPYSSDPKKAWEDCFSKHHCIVLMHNQLYKCEQLACAAHAYRNGIFSEKWKDVLNYRPLSPAYTMEEMREFMKEVPVKECRICPEVFEVIGIHKKSYSLGQSPSTIR